MAGLRLPSLLTLALTLGASRRDAQGRHCPIGSIPWKSSVLNQAPQFFPLSFTRKLWLIPAATAMFCFRGELLHPLELSFILGKTWFSAVCNDRPTI